MSAAISLKGLNKHYDDFSLQDVDLELPAGQIMGLVGVNGAGKSTLMRLLMGLIKADRGVVEVCGHRMPEEQVAAKMQIGYASDDMRLYKGQTLRWHMNFVKSIYAEWDEEYAAGLLKRFDLRAHQRLGSFSHGQRVKALLLLVLSRRPKLLLLDEPTTGLDPVARIEVLEALAEVLRDERRSVLFSSHNTKDIEQLSDSITFIHQGKIISSLDKDTFLDGWRRVICQGNWSDALTLLPGVASARRNGSLIEFKVERFEESFLFELQNLGLSVTRSEPMSLEEIFIASVRNGAPAWKF